MYRSTSLIIITPYCKSGHVRHIVCFCLAWTWYRSGTGVTLKQYAARGSRLTLNLAHSIISKWMGASKPAHCRLPAGAKYKEAIYNMLFWFSDLRCSSTYSFKYPTACILGRLHSKVMGAWYVRVHRPHIGIFRCIKFLESAIYISKSAASYIMRGCTQPLHIN